MLAKWLQFINWHILAKVSFQLDKFAAQLAVLEWEVLLDTKHLLGIIQSKEAVEKQAPVWPYPLPNGNGLRHASGPILSNSPVTYIQYNVPFLNNANQSKYVNFTWRKNIPSL